MDESDETCRAGWQRGLLEAPLRLAAAFAIAMAAAWVVSRYLGWAAATSGGTGTRYSMRLLTLLGVAAGFLHGRCLTWRLTEGLGLSPRPLLMPVLLAVVLLQVGGYYAADALFPGLSEPLWWLFCVTAAASAVTCGVVLILDL